MKKRMVIVVMSLLFLCSGSVSSAQATTLQVGGGKWTYTYISGVMAVSKYQHQTKRHSATAQVGNSRKKDTKPAGQTAAASKVGTGVASCWWNTY